jgi:Ca2+-binding EF-hand superfamily protein
MAVSDVESNRNSARKAKTEDEMYQLLSEYFDTFDVNKNNALSFDEIVKMLKQI